MPNSSIDSDFSVERGTLCNTTESQIGRNMSYICNLHFFSYIDRATHKVFSNKKTRSVCLSGYAFHGALISHGEILNTDPGHIFRKYRHKNNKKVTLIYEKTVKKSARYQGICRQLLDVVKATRT